jgi:agmatinase
MVIPCDGNAGTSEGEGQVSTGYPSWADLRASLFVTGRDFPLIADETPTFMGVPYADGPEALVGADVAIIGSPYVASSTGEYAGVAAADWQAGPKRVRQQSIRYRSAYVQDFDVDMFDVLRVVDYGDAPAPPADRVQTPEAILEAQRAVEAKVGDVLRAGALPIVIGQNSPCGSYAVAKAVADHTAGNVGVVSLDAHWDVDHLDSLTGDPRIAGGGCWLRKTLEFHESIRPENLLEIGPSGMLEDATGIRELLAAGVGFVSGWDVKRLGIESVCERLDAVYDGTAGTYAHFDMDVIGGAGPAAGDLLGDLAEPLGLGEYEVLRIAHELGLRGVTAFSFICIPPGSVAVYRLVVAVIAYLLAGKALRSYAAGARDTHHDEQ